MKYHKLNPKAIVPARATEGSAGYDLCIPEDVTIHKGRQIIPLGLAVALPESTCGWVRPRSGFSSKGMEDANGIRRDADVMDGIVDSDYRQSIGVIVKSNEEEPFVLKAGTRIAQLLIVPHLIVTWQEAEMLGVTGRVDGFGSTGTR